MFTIDMYRSRWIAALITAIVSLVLILFLSGTVTLTNKEEELLYEAMSEEQARRGYDSAIINMMLPSGRSTTTVQAAARWDDRRIRFSEKSPEQKLIVIVKIAIVVLLLYVIGSAMLSEKMSIFSYIVDGRWDRGMNIFAFSACVLVLIAINFAVMLLRIPIKILAALLGARGETVGHLLLSVIKYGSALFGIFYCMYLLGIDSSRLLAGAGILSLIIGLGAQSLIKDILAGIFIVFEGEFRVGDIVTINNYRGRVLDIGLRTTKIMGVDSNIKIYNNSEISGILNMTQESSIAICKILIEYGQDIEYVEAVLKRELPKLKAENPKIMNIPEYLGISALGESGVELVITCHCSEADILEVNRYLNRAVLKIFYDNNINVPFNTITVAERAVIQEKKEEDGGE